MVIDGIYLIPHGDELIDLPDEQSREMRTHIINGTADDSSDTIVVLTPHGLSLDGMFSICGNKNLSGSYLTEGGKAMEMKLENDSDLFNTILNANRNIMSRAAFSGGAQTAFPIDFGSLIPLSFFKSNKAVLIGQSRIWDIAMLYTLGESLHDILSMGSTKYSIVFSADQAHTHSAEGPYGYSPKAQIYDHVIRNCATSSDFSGLFTMDRTFVEEAKPDSYWIMIVLAGFMSRNESKLLFKYYYVAKYFGMLYADSHETAQKI
ncbi:MAG: DODA-type extradiol aromatic ring-opening family dioxygenase [Thermoplasmataceae archaeon]